jgi:phage/plasmid primase-like uncharacterized protein
MLMMAASTEDPEQAFRDAASRHGITLPDTLDSKKIQRFDPATGKLKKDGSGWCRFHNDNLPAGAFGDFATGVNEKWHAKLNGKLTEQERLEHHRRIETLAREAEYKKRHQQKEAAKVAATHWAEAVEATDTHAYLLDKGVHSYGLRLREGKLIMPLRDADNALHSYQSIDEKGNKRFLGGGLVEGLFFVIGVITPGILYIAEGYASAASVHEASGRPVIVALNCGNLLAVAKALRAKYPEAELVFCADADSWTGKPGENKADEAARAVCGKVTVPVFVEMRTIDEKPTDFNDLHQFEGLEAVRRCLANAKAPSPSAEQKGPAPEPAGQSDADKLQAAIDRLALLNLDEYELRRDPESKAHKVRIGYLDKQVEKARKAIAAAQQEERFARAAGSAYVTKSGLPQDNIGAIADMELETTAKGKVINKSYVNAAISIAKRLGIRGKHDIFKDRHWIVFKGKVVELTDPLIRTIQAEVAKDLGTDGGIGNVTHVLHYLCELNPFHPVRDHLTALEWDKTERMKDWLERTFGCTEPKEYLAAVGRMFLISMVARIMQPGCQADYKLIIEGEQGLMKSSALRTLAVKAEWFSDALPKLGRDEVRVSMHMKGLWLIEVAEMHATGKADNEEIKAFITRRVERYVSKYGRVVSDEPRECIFAGTTNREGYFTDETGARRYWPIYAHKADLEWLKENLDQLWAEAVHAYESGEHWWPDREFEEKVIKPQQGDRKEEPALTQPIRQYLNKKAEWPIGEPGAFQFEIWKDLAGGTMNPRAKIDYTDKDMRAISKALKHLGYTNKLKRYPTGSDAPKRKWWPPEKPAEPPPPFMEPTLCDDGCSDFDAGEDA